MVEERQPVMDPMADVSENILSSSMKRRRQSEIVRSSLTVGESTLPIIRQLSNMNSTSDWGRSRDATNFPNLPKPSKQQDRLAGSSSSLIGAIEAYNAKSVFFYKDGDEYFTGIRVPISKARYRNIDSLLDNLSQSIPLPYGVRGLHTPSGRTKIESLSDLKHNGSYIACSTKQPRGLNFDEVERKRRIREEATRNWQKQRTNISIGIVSNHKNGSAENDEMAQSKTRAKFMPVKHANPAFSPSVSKQVHFVLNGHPHRVFRVRLNSEKQVSFGALLNEVSQGLRSAIFRLYNFDGAQITGIDQLLELREPRVVAVPRSERLQLNGTLIRKRTSTSSDQLPPIVVLENGTKSSQSSSSGGSMRRLSRSTRLPYSNSIDRRASYANANGRLDMAKKPVAKKSPLLTNNMDKRALPKVPRNKTEGPVNTTRKMKRHHEKLDTIVPKRTPEAILSRSSSSFNMTPTRVEQLKSATRINRTAQFIARKSASVDNRLDDLSDDDYPEEPPEVRRMREQSLDTNTTTDDETPPIKRGNIKAESTSSKGDNENTQTASTESRTKEIVESPKAKNEDEEFAGERIMPSLEVTVATAVPLDTPFNGNNGQNLLLEAGTSNELELIENDIVNNKNNSDKTAQQNIGIPNILVIDDARKEDMEQVANEMRQYGELHYKAAVTIQKHWRRFNTKKIQARQASMDNDDDEGDQVRVLSSNSRHGGLRPPLSPVAGKRQSSPFSKSKTQKTEFIYTVTIVTGLRWAADTEADLYIVLHGENEIQSEKIYIRQKDGELPKFIPHQPGSFGLTLSVNLGIINKLTVGHERRGYGAGIFIDRILVTEEREKEDLDARQYLYICNKWFDTGQVDGRIERQLKLTAFSEIASIPLGRDSKGRWEFVLHGGASEEHGGTTSNLTITGYGTKGQSRTTDLYDSRLMQTPSEGLFQIDFGEIGELYKVRVEIDGTGTKPDFFLNDMEIVDLDTDERSYLMCGKWLRWNDEGQTFRELAVFHIGVEPFPLITYEGELTLSLPSMKLSHSKELYAEIFGEFGETGTFNVSLQNENEINKDRKNNSRNSEELTIPIKVEAVSIGRVFGVRINLVPTAIGEEIYEGLFAIQKLLDQHHAGKLAENSNWIISSCVLKESRHTPFRYIIDRSVLRERYDEKDPFVKEIIASDMEGLSTKRAKKIKRKEPEWTALVTIDSVVPSRIPELVLCGELGSIPMKISSEPVPGAKVLKYHQNHPTTKLGELRKIRISFDKSIRLSGKTANMKDENGGSLILPPDRIKKIIVRDEANGDEIRPEADVEMFRNSVFEFPAIWPDCNPLPSVVYGVRISTGASTNVNPEKFAVQLNLYGELGDVGFRLLENEVNHPQNEFEFLFKPHSKNSFEFGAVSIGEIEFAEILVESSDTNFTWECEELVVTDLSTSLFYVFKFPKPLTASRKRQKCAVLPFTSAL